jgi:2-succinyl-5-enolpyruvyl-6-hydroxy-3-cyclohexene-1-carboxylate synthase
LLPVGETAPRLQVVVGNDGGGTIFDGLEVAEIAGPDAMQRVLYTPQDVDLARWPPRTAGSTCASPRAELDQALTARVVGRQIIEVALAR